VRGRVGLRGRTIERLPMGVGALAETRHDADAGYPSFARAISQSSCFHWEGEGLVDVGRMLGK